jgi:hypothetical protein
MQINLHKWTSYGAEQYLKGPQHFMEPEGSVPHLQEFSTGSHWFSAIAILSDPLHNH